MRTLVAAAVALNSSIVLLVHSSDDPIRVVGKEPSQAQGTEERKGKGEERVNRFNMKYIIS
jgi:hypothetical protein